MEKRIRKKDIAPEVIELGKRIESIIKSKNLKTRYVAYDADLDVENLRKYIKGRQEMKITTLLRIAKALSVNPCELLTKKEAL
jgi:transcriptional regulator with XRE-family HTH domain